MQKTLLCPRCNSRFDAKTSFCQQCGGTLRTTSAAPWPLANDEEVKIELDVRSECSVCGKKLEGIHFQLRGLCPEHEPHEAPKPKTVIHSAPIHIVYEGRKTLVTRVIPAIVVVFAVVMSGMYYLTHSSESGSKKEKPKSSPMGSQNGFQFLAQAPNSAKQPLKSGKSGAPEADSMLNTQGEFNVQPRAGLTPQQAISKIEQILGVDSAKKLSSGWGSVKAGGPTKAPSESGSFDKTGRAKLPAELGSLNNTVKSQGTHKAGREPSFDFADPTGRVAASESRSARSHATETEAETSEIQPVSKTELRKLVTLGRCRDATEAIASAAAERGTYGIVDYMYQLATCDGKLAAAFEVGHSVVALKDIPQNEANLVRAAMAEIAFLQDDLPRIRGTCAGLSDVPEQNDGSSILWRMKARCGMLEGRFPSQVPPANAALIDRSLWQLSRIARGESVNDRNFPSWSLEGAWVEAFDGFRHEESMLFLLDRLAEPFFAPVGSNLEPLTVPLSSYELDTLVSAIVPGAERKALAKSFLVALQGGGSAATSDLKSGDLQSDALMAAIAARSGNVAEVNRVLPKIKTREPHVSIQLIRALTDEEQSRRKLRPLLGERTVRARVFRSLAERALATPEDFRAMATMEEHPDIIWVRGKRE